MEEGKIIEGELIISPNISQKENKTASEIISQGATLVKLENNTQMTVAVQRPRDESKILDTALKELEIYPSLAEEALYSKPVGKDEYGKMHHATGLSIRAAESLANRWGNNAYGCEIVAEDENYATLSAVYLDYEKNTRTVLQKRVSKFYKKKGSTQIIRYSPDRFDIVLAAAQSKLLREAILRRLPAGLKREYELKVKEILKNKPIKERQEKMLEKFSTIGINKEQLEALRCKPLSQFNHEDLTELIGIFNALKDGETTIEALLEKQTPSQPLYDLPEETLGKLMDYFKILNYSQANISMKLASCKGDPEKIKKLEEELLQEISKLNSQQTQQSEKQEKEIPIVSLPKAEDIFNNKKTSQKKG